MINEYQTKVLNSMGNGWYSLADFPAKQPTLDVLVNKGYVKKELFKGAIWLYTKRGAISRLIWAVLAFIKDIRV
uniref:Uncharacterized protein n=1 Tax=viral metagenome TaxID=1070528 RepID=A0A6M3L2C8_9ZZZZ